jgi:hypothetical protein
VGAAEGMRARVARSRQAFTATFTKIHGHLETLHGHQIFHHGHFYGHITIHGQKFVKALKRFYSDKFTLKGIVQRIISGVDNMLK